jgi:hypothetical protein
MEDIKTSVGDRGDRRPHCGFRVAIAFLDHVTCDTKRKKIRAAKQSQ